MSRPNLFDPLIVYELVLSELRTWFPLQRKRRGTTAPKGAE